MLKYEKKEVQRGNSEMKDFMGLTFELNQREGQK